MLKLGGGVPRTLLVILNHVLAFLPFRLHESARSYSQISQVGAIVIFRHFRHMDTATVATRLESLLHFLTQDS